MYKYTNTNIHREIYKKKYTRVRKSPGIALCIPQEMALKTKSFLLFALFTLAPAFLK